MIYNTILTVSKWFPVILGREGSTPQLIIKPFRSWVKCVRAGKTCRACSPPPHPRE